MKPFAVLTALLLATVPFTVGASLPASPAPTEALDERVYVLVMEGNAFNFETYPDTPLLEAYAGERMTFLVHVPAHAEMHTFHLHGHPWEDPNTGAVIDTALLNPGETHTFQQTAGLEDGHTGDWLYHCHVTTHFNHGMWGLLRVYPHAMNIEGTLDDLTITLTHADGAPVQDASFTVRLHEEARGDPTPASLDEGDPIPALATETTPGTYTLTPDLPEDATGQLVIESDHPTGESLARLTLHTDGTFEENRHVGLENAPTTLEPLPAFAKDTVDHATSSTQSPIVDR